MLIQRSITASILIILIIIIRSLAINKLPKRTFLVMWIISMIHLLIPYQVSSRFSIYNIFNNKGNSHDFLELQIGNTIKIPTGRSMQIEGLSQKKYNNNFGLMLTLIWLIGFLLCMIYFAGLYYYSRTKIMYSSQVENGFVDKWLKQNKIYRKIQVRQTKDIISPLTYGILRPVILVPRKMDWSNKEQLNYVFCHEFIHIKYFDSLLKIFLLFTLSVYWFNPIIWAMYILANRDIELACDETVIRRYGENVKSNYALMLIGLEEIKSGHISIVNYFSKNAIEERITSIMKIRKKSVIVTLFSSVLTIVLVLLFTTSTLANKNNLSKEEELKAVEAHMIEEDAQVDKIETKTKSYYSNDEYELITSLKTEDYLNLTVAEFNNKLEEEINNNDKFLDIWAKVCNGIEDSDPNYSFVMQELSYSCVSYMMKLMNETPYVENTASYKEFPFYCDAYYYLEYKITDENKITLGERSDIFQQVYKELNSYVKSMGKNELLSSSAETKIETKLEEIINDLTNPYISIKGEVTSYSLYNGENTTGI